MRLAFASAGHLLEASFCLCVACGGACSALRAQAVPQEPPPEVFRGQGFEAPPTEAPANDFHALATLGERWNSNVHFEPEDGSPESDYIGTLQLQLLTHRHSDRTSWGLNYRPLFSHYHENSDLDSLSHVFDADASYKLARRSTLTLQERFSQSEDPLIVTAPPESGDAAILTDTERRSRNLTGLDIDMDLSRSVALSVGALYGGNWFENPRATDSDFYVGRIGLSGKLGREDSLSGSYAYSVLNLDPPEPTFTVPPIPGEVVTQNVDTTSNELGLGWTHSVTRWASDIYLGSSLADQHLLDYNATGLIDDRHVTERLFTGRASLRRSFRHVALDSGVQRRLTADTGANIATVGDSAYLTIAGNAGRRTTYTLTLDAGNRKSIGGISENTLDYAGATFRFGYAFSQWCGLLAIAQGREQTIHRATDERQDVESYFLGLTFKIH